MATLSFHPDAETHFNQEADRVLGLLETRPFPAPPQAQRTVLDIHTQSVPKSAIKGPVTGGYQTPEGTELAIYREVDGDLVGFFGPAYKELEKMVHTVHRQPALRDLVTSKEVVTAFFEWSLKKNKAENAEPFMVYLDQHFAGLLAEHEVWVPINGLMLLGDINLGPAVLRPISKVLIEQWRHSCGRASPFPAESLDRLFQRDFQPIQGFAAGVVKRTGTLKRVTEVAMEDISRIVEIIRAFHFPALRSGVRSHLALKGQEGRETKFVFTIGPEGCPRPQHSIVGSVPMDFFLDQEQFSRLMQCGTWYVCGWLFRKRTALEEQILLSLSLLSKSALTTNLSDRLVYVFAALESLLLVGEADPILHALAERFAFFVANDGTTRREMRDRIRKVYGLRSGFIHHGHAPSDRDLVDQFLFDVHMFFILLVNRSKDFESKDALLHRIDEIKLNGESFGHDYPDPGTTEV